MLDVFLLSAFTHLGHECLDLLSPCDGVYVTTDWTLIYTHLKEFIGNGVKTHGNSKRKITCTLQGLRGGSNPTLHQAGR